jgi:hypothetical protein
MRQTQRFVIASFLASAICLLAVHGCFIGDKCDEHQVEATPMHACVCEPGYVISAKGYGCEKCGKHEEVVSGKCVCEKGYSRTSDSEPCQANDGTAIGSPCSGADECADPNPYCAESEDAPYCTSQGCEVSDDCPKDWRCASAGEDRFCQKPPSGYGKACQSSADCSDPEAPYCETFMNKICIINDCTADPGKCLSQTSCCDLKALIGQALCVPNAMLVDGKCFGGTSPVRP